MTTAEDYLESVLSSLAEVRGHLKDADEEVRAALARIREEQSAKKERKHADENV